MYDCILVKCDASLCFIANLLSANGIAVKKIAKSDTGCKFFIKSSDYKLFCDLMNRHNKCFTVLSDNSKSFFIRKNAPRIGIYLGLVLVIVGIIFYSLNVTRVEIGELKWVNKADIYSAVTEKINLPSKKTSVDCKEIEKAVISLDGISSASVYLLGNTLVVNVYEELEKVPVLDKSDYTDIVSNFDAIITSVIVYSGSASVKKGDTVRQGQTLISSDILLDEEKGLVAKEKPLGEIYGRVWITETKTFYPYVVEKKRTGKTETVVKCFCPQKEYKGKFSLYDAETEEFFLNSVIPIKMYKTTYYEVEEIEREFDFDGNTDGIIKEETEKLEERLPTGCKKLRSWYDIKRLDKITYLALYYEIETKIN